MAAQSSPTQGQYQGFHHLEFWVGNAKQTATWFIARLGFEPVAYKGLETGDRDTVTHVVQVRTVLGLVRRRRRCGTSNQQRGAHFIVPPPTLCVCVCACACAGEQQGQVRFAFTSALNPDNAELATHHAKHGDGVRDVAIRVKDCHALYATLVRYAGACRPQGTAVDECTALEMSSRARQASIRCGI